MVADHTRGAHPRLLGRRQTVVLFGSHTLPSRTVALLTQTYPAERGALVTQTTLRTWRQLSATWAHDFQFELGRVTVPRDRGLESSRTRGAR